MKIDFKQWVTSSPLITDKPSYSGLERSRLFVGLRCFYFEGSVPELPVSVVWNSSYLTKPDGDACPGNVSVRLIQTSVTAITHITHTHAYKHSVHEYMHSRYKRSYKCREFT